MKAYKEKYKLKLAEKDTSNVSSVYNWKLIEFPDFHSSFYELTSLFVIEIFELGLGTGMDLGGGVQPN